MPLWQSLHKNPQATGFSDLLCCWTTSMCQEGAHSNSRTEASQQKALQTWPSVSLHQAIHLYPFKYLLALVKLTIFLRSERQLRKLTNPKRETWELPVCNHIEQKLWGSWAPPLLVMGIWSRGQICGTEILTRWGLHLTLVCVRIEL